MAQERPTLEIVAKRAAVSRQTVSNVINAPHRVRAETIERVRSVIDELGYRPSLAARQLKTRRSRVIGLRLESMRDGINGSVLDRFVHALTDAAQGAGYRVMLFTADDDAAEIEQYDELLRTVDIDAFVLASTHLGDPRTSWLAERDITFVSFGRPWGTPSANGGDATHPWVDVDGATGTRLATQHLLDQGHHRIAFLGWPSDEAVADDRRRGWSAAMREAGLRADLDIATLDEVPNGVAATRDLLAAADPPTAVVCSSDSLAIGALTAAEGLAVTGFDDTSAAAAMGLTSLRQPLVDAADHAVRVLVGQLDGAATRPEPRRLLTPELIVRTSSERSRFLRTTR